MTGKGRSIYYVRIEGGGGFKIANGSTDRLREMQIKGEGLKSRKLCERNKWMLPYGMNTAFSSLPDYLRDVPQLY